MFKLIACPQFKEQSSPCVCKASTVLLRCSLQPWLLGLRLPCTPPSSSHVVLALSGAYVCHFSRHMSFAPAVSSSLPSPHLFSRLPSFRPLSTQRFSKMPVLPSCPGSASSWECSRTAFFPFRADMSWVGGMAQWLRAFAVQAQGLSPNPHYPHRQPCMSMCFWPFCYGDSDRGITGACIPLS